MEIEARGVDDPNDLSFQRMLEVTGSDLLALRMACARIAKIDDKVATDVIREEMSKLCLALSERTDGIVDQMAYYADAAISLIMTIVTMDEYLRMQIEIDEIENGGADEREQ